jgi:hypothetical protein
MKITNFDEVSQFVKRRDYRQGWKTLTLMKRLIINSKNLKLKIFVLHYCYDMIQTTNAQQAPVPRI